MSPVAANAVTSKPSIGITKKPREPRNCNFPGCNCKGYTPQPSRRSARRSWAARLYQSELSLEIPYLRQFTQVASHRPVKFHQANLQKCIRKFIYRTTTLFDSVLMTCFRVWLVFTRSRSPATPLSTTLPKTLLATPYLATHSKKHRDAWKITSGPFGFSPSRRHWSCSA